MKREMCGESPRWKLRLWRDEAETKKTRDCTNPAQFSGDNGERDPPVPIPNPEVKPFSADGTWLETTRESRTLPDSKIKRIQLCWVLFILPSVTPYPPRLFSSQRAALYLVRIWPAARCAGFRQAKSPGRVGRCHGIMQGGVQAVLHMPQSFCMSRTFHNLGGRAMRAHYILNEHTFKFPLSRGVSDWVWGSFLHRSRCVAWNILFVKSIYAYIYILSILF